MTQIPYLGFLISAAASDTQLESCQKGTLWLVVAMYENTFLQQIEHAPLAIPLVTGLMIGWVKPLLFNT